LISSKGIRASHRSSGSSTVLNLFLSKY
jgi:hypothetical protein